jgi:hypothetical protein
MAERLAGPDRMGDILTGRDGHIADRKRDEHHTERFGAH